MIAGSKIKLRKKKLGDAKNDYAWQTDTELAHLDATTVLTASFARYLLDYAYELNYPSSTRHRFAVETIDGKHIGNCGYYDIDEDKGEAQLGIVIGNRNYWNQGYGTEAVTTLVSHIFQHTILERIYLKTLTENIRAQKCFQKCGFTPYGHLNMDGYDFVLMEVHHNRRQTKVYKQQPGKEKR